MSPTSVTETYAAIRLDINTRRWAGVPFYLRAGKRLGRRVTEIAVVFKRAPQYLFAESQTSALGQNALVIRVQPDEGVTIRFGSKVPGAGMQVRDVTMDFGYGHAFTEASPEAYERLILDVLLGDPPLFPRHEEVELSWKILDPIEEYWATLGSARAVPARHLGSGLRRRAARPRRARLEASVIVDLPDTTTNADREGARQDPRGGRRRRPRPRADPGHRHAARRRGGGHRGRQRRLPRAPDARDRALQARRRPAARGRPARRRDPRRRRRRARARSSSCAPTATRRPTRRGSSRACCSPTHPSSSGGRTNAPVSPERLAAGQDRAAPDHRRRGRRRTRCRPSRASAPTTPPATPTSPGPG